MERIILQNEWGGIAVVPVSREGANSDLIESIWPADENIVISKLAGVDFIMGTFEMKRICTNLVSADSKQSNHVVSEE